MNHHISSLALFTLLISFSASYAAPGAAADVKAAMDAKAGAADATEQPKLLLTLSDVQSALGQGTSDGIDEAVCLLKLFCRKQPLNQHVHTTIRQLMAHTCRMSDAQQVQATRLNSLVNCSYLPPEPKPVPVNPPAELEVKGRVAANVSNFEQIAQLQRTNFQITRNLHAFVAEQARYILSGQNSKEISEKVHAATNDPERATFPPDLSRMIGQYAASGAAIDIDFILMQIQKSDLAPQMTNQMRAAETVVKNILQHNAPRVTAYRDLNRRGVPWPFSPKEKRRWEAAGFAFRPMMVKRARMVCDICSPRVITKNPDGTESLEVIGVNHSYINADYTLEQSYLEPADHHNYSIKHPEGIAKLQAHAIQNPAICTLTDHSDLKFIGYVVRHVNLRALQIAQLPAERVNADIAAGLLSQGLSNAAKLWTYFADCQYQLMGWAIMAKFTDQPFDFDDAAIDPYCNYANLQKQMLKE